MDRKWSQKKIISIELQLRPSEGSGNSAVTFLKQPVTVHKRIINGFSWNATDRSHRYFTRQTPEWQQQSTNCRAERDGQLRAGRAVRKELEKKGAGGDKKSEGETQKEHRKGKETPSGEEIGISREE